MSVQQCKPLNYVGVEKTKCGFEPKFGNYAVVQVRNILNNPRFGVEISERDTQGNETTL